VHLVQVGDDIAYRLAAPGVEEVFREIAVPFGERGFPGAVMERHGIDDGAVAVEYVAREGGRRAVAIASIDLLQS